MKACGIVAEYNPFHNGHLYQLTEAKKKSGADIVIAAMSGNFLQRGEPALLDKWTRANIALKNGVDIVVEIPAAFSVQPADFFAKGSLALLDYLGCDFLSFGSESGTGADFYEAAQLYLDQEDEIDASFQLSQEQKYTYAQNMTDVLTQIFPNFPIDVSQPNNMLGFSYAKELIRLKSKMKIHTITRKDSQYHDQDIKDRQYIASATSIRKRVLAKEQTSQLINKVVPIEAVDALKENKLVSWDDYFSYLKYQVTVLSINELESIYLMEKGLAYRIKRIMADSDNMTNFLTKLKTRQLTWTRLQRLSFYILLNQSKRDMEKRLEKVKSVRLLGFTEKGQAYLSQIKQEIPVPLLTNINKKTNEWVDFDIKAGNVYRLADEASLKSQDYKRKPIKIIDIPH